MTSEILEDARNKKKGAVNIDNTTQIGESTLSYIDVILIMLFTVPSFITIYHCFPRVLTNLHVNMITWSFELLILVVLVLIFIDRISENAHSKFTSTLERLIALDDLAPIEIVRIYTKEYIGDDIKQWLADRNIKASEMRKRYNVALATATSTYNDINMLDKSLTFEVIGRANTACHKGINDITEYILFLTRTLEQLRQLIDGAKLDDERDFLQSVIDELDNEVKTERNKCDELCALCKELVAPHPLPCTPE